MRTANRFTEMNGGTTGVFAGPVIDLKFQTPSRTGITNQRGEFEYGKGEAVTHPNYSYP